MARLWILLAVAVLFVALSETEAVCSAHKKCGCYHGWCWAYADWEHMKSGDPWCFTQRLGVTNGKQSFASCLADDDCQIEMTCGEKATHTGDDGGRPGFAPF
ncbi:uncharacterized protein LOC129585336 [Paramacrobiotus metropolitanus]|uniref:uncharacterized protein LOC129585336 n=1 Tax=Paramacrobiotus metropolitanus TaxID=2943436 RepID=UPI002445DAE7|nr:uncharacterized protein LOC129585336 [Paramacrobiotus metropolitanus]